MRDVELIGRHNRFAGRGRVAFSDDHAAAAVPAERQVVSSRRRPRCRATPGCAPGRGSCTTAARLVGITGCQRAHAAGHHVFGGEAGIDAAAGAGSWPAASLRQSTARRPARPATRPGQRRTSRRPRPAVPVRLSSRRTLLRLTRASCTAGAMPMTMPRTTARPSVNASTAPSIRISCARGRSEGPASPRRPGSRSPTSTPRVPPITREQQRLGDQLACNATAAPRQARCASPVPSTAHWPAPTKDSRC